MLLTDTANSYYTVVCSLLGYAERKTQSTRLDGATNRTHFYCCCSYEYAGVHCHHSSYAKLSSSQLSGRGHFEIAEHPLSYSLTAIFADLTCTTLPLARKTFHISFHIHSEPWATVQIFKTPSGSS